MNTTNKTNWLSLLFFLLLPLAAGGLSTLLSMPFSPSGLYQTLIRPPLSPPAFLFPIVWTVLYLLMGFSSYLIAQSSSSLKSDALFNYGVQLFVNFFWPILFFRFQAYFAAFTWLVFLWILVYHLIRQFYQISKPAAWLLVPYLTWITFAGYLNFSIYLLNQ
ncbi:MAG: tryptophan-rich sensory protein [Lachnospiraceae bacterium]|nr:tryptophan-rich sensory protein [Lachnospiraceae bacterium]